MGSYSARHDVDDHMQDEGGAAPGAGAEVLDLPGFLKNFAGQHDGLVGRGYVCIEDGDVVRVLQADSAVGGGE